VTYQDGIFEPIEDVKGVRPGQHFTVFSDGAVLDAVNALRMNMSSARPRGRPSGIDGICARRTTRRLRDRRELLHTNVPVALAGRLGKPYSTGMSPLRACVRRCRLVLDQPRTLPDGTVVHLIADDEGDDLTDDERRDLHDALSASWNSAETGKHRPASAILNELRQRR